MALTRTTEALQRFEAQDDEEEEEEEEEGGCGWLHVGMMALPLTFDIFDLTDDMLQYQRPKPATLRHADIIKLQALEVSCTT